MSASVAFSLIRSIFRSTMILLPISRAYTLGCEAMSARGEHTHTLDDFLFWVFRLSKTVNRMILNVSVFLCHSTAFVSFSEPFCLSAPIALGALLP